MNLSKLFEAQKVVRKKIIETNGLEGQDLIQNSILALRVELGELANEQRSWKHWSKDRAPRTFVREDCPDCKKKGFYRGNPPKDKDKGVHGLGNHCYDCKRCRGFLVVDNNPLLEEYADCISFALELALELGIESGAKVEEILIPYSARKNITKMLNQVYLSISDLEVNINYHYARKNAVLSEYNGLLTNLITLGILLGFEYEQIEAAYFEKNAINLKRQEEGY